MPDVRTRTHRSHDRIVAGVAAGWADRWQVEPTVVRAALGLLTLTGGIGAVFYAAATLWSLPPAAPSPPRPPDQRRHLAIASSTLAIVLLARRIGLWPGDEVMVAASAIAVGVAASWQPFTRRRGHRWLLAAAGVALVGTGVISLANRTRGLASVGASASAIAIAVFGFFLLGAPALGRILRQLDEERSLRALEDQRATIAAHLHDSVLQSLVLIQRADDPRRMVSLARRQERDLRAWLYGAAPASAPQSLDAAIQAMVLDVEENHDVRVEAVVVGDQPLDDAARTLVGAVKEAVVNAARHGDVAQVDVFIEADDTELTGFVRDTGRGFDATLVPPDRHGITDSICGRVQRAGGVATLASTMGAGTEVDIRVPRKKARP